MFQLAGMALPLTTQFDSNLLTYPVHWSHRQITSTHHSQKQERVFGRPRQAASNCIMGFLGDDSPMMLLRRNRTAVDKYCTLKGRWRHRNASRTLAEPEFEETMKP